MWAILVQNRDGYVREWLRGSEIYCRQLLGLLLLLPVDGWEFNSLVKLANKE